MNVFIHQNMIFKSKLVDFVIAIGRIMINRCYDNHDGL